MRFPTLAALVGAAALPALANVTVTLQGPKAPLGAGELYIFNATVDGTKQDSRCTWAVVELRDLGSGQAFEAPAPDVKLTFMDDQGNIRPAGMDGHGRVFFTATGTSHRTYRTFQVRAMSVEQREAFATATFRVAPGRGEAKEDVPGATDRVVLQPYVWETPFTAFMNDFKFRHRTFDASAPAPTLAVVDAHPGKRARLLWLPFAGKEPAAAVELPDGARFDSEVQAMPDGTAVVVLHDPVRLCRVTPAGKVTLIAKDGVPWTPGEGKADKACGAADTRFVYLAADPDGGWAVAAAGRIFRVAPDGTATVLAGGGTGGTGQDLTKSGRPALQMNMADIGGLTVARDGRILFLVHGRGVYELPPDGVARLVWADPSLLHNLLETADGRLVASDGQSLFQMGSRGVSLLLCAGTTRRRNDFTSPIPEVPLTSCSAKKVGFLHFPVEVPGGGLLVQEQWTHRILYLGPPGGDDALVERVNAATAAVEKGDFALAAQIRDRLHLEAGINADPLVLKRVNKKADLTSTSGQARLPGPIMRKIMAAFEIPKGDMVRARIASHVLERQIEGLPTAARTAFQSYLERQAMPGRPAESKTESKTETKAETKAS